MAKGYGVEASAKEIITIIVFVIGVILLLPYLLKLLIRGTASNIGDLVSDAGTAVSDAYTGKATMEERLDNYDNMWKATEAALAAGKSSYVFNPAWLNQPVEVIASMPREEYEARKAEAEAWMTIAPSDDIGITAPYGSEIYNKWASAHPLTAYEGVENKTPKESVDYYWAGVEKRASNLVSPKWYLDKLIAI